MNLNENGIKGNPIYKKEVIRYRAKLDGDDKRARIENEKKKKEQRKKLIINLIFGLIIYLMMYFMLLKPLANMF
jgi:hypothetical protein